MALSKERNLLCLLLLVLFLPAFAPCTAGSPYRILVGSPVRQKPAILHEFLESLKNLDQDGYKLDYCFVDDNLIAESSARLEYFAQECGSHCEIIRPGKKDGHKDYVCEERTHTWRDAAIWKVARFKDEIMQYALSNDYDYVFLIDSDLVLHPRTINQLLLANKDIVSNIFWTSWQPGCREEPQVWLYDQYTQYQVVPDTVVPDDVQKAQVMAFYAQLRQPGVYEVGGLGACTLISQHALQKGVSFKKISNLTFWGEDRHFCVRAVAIGLSLFVDTHYPAYHIYRESNLSGVQDFIKSCRGINHHARLN